MNAKNEGERERWEAIFEEKKKQHNSVKAATECAAAKVNLLQKTFTLIV